MVVPILYMILLIYSLQESLKVFFKNNEFQFDEENLYMASTMLHYIIASKIVKELDIEDAEFF